MSISTFNLNDQLTANLGKSYAQFQEVVHRELTKELIEQAVEEFREKITPIIIETVTKISITSMNSYFEQMHLEPRVNIQFKL
jgi:hypothetical protein